MSVPWFYSCELQILNYVGCSLVYFKTINGTDFWLMSSFIFCRRCRWHPGNGRIPDSSIYEGVVMKSRRIRALLHIKYIGHVIHSGIRQIFNFHWDFLELRCQKYSRFVFFGIDVTGTPQQWFYYFRTWLDPISIVIIQSNKDADENIGQNYNWWCLCALWSVLKTVHVIAPSFGTQTDSIPCDKRSILASILW